ncbi:MAG: Caspase domain protein [Bacteroidetes bacterium ADurb.BinA104]|nr:MAG: Caspase domain protein [Bacteroidetes bacterium ADurb.BinA104]
MCWGKKSIVWPHHNKVALLFGKNNTHYGTNKLSFCVNDIQLARTKLEPYGFQFRMFSNEKVTRKNFREQLTYAFLNSQPGDIIYIKYSGHGSYIKDLNSDEIDGFDETLYMDGHFSDDETAELVKLIPEGVIVLFSLDCCYSGTSTRNFTTPRFMPPKKEYAIRRHIKRRSHADMKHMVFSGCSENEVSEEAEINGTGYGIFTYHEMTTLRPDLTYRKWFDQIRMYLPSKTFKQTPLFEGNEEYMDRIVFQ